MHLGRHPLCTDEGYRPLGAFVDNQLENIGARVVPDDVQVKFSARYLLKVDFGYQYGFAIELRCDKELPERIDDTASAP